MKRYKVKHYRSRIYNPIRGKIIKGVLIAVISVCLFAIGWFSYEPLMEAINEKNKDIIQQEPVPEKPQEPVFVPEEEEFLEKETVAVVVPEEKLYSSIDYHGFLKSLGEEVTAVVIDVKTQTGTVTYVSDQVSVKNAGASHEKAVNLGMRIKTAKDLGFDVVARIYAFEDSTAPYNATDMAIRYGSADGILWLDDSVDNGGKPWLNPYSDTAQKYILDIIYDTVDAGADAILLEGVRLPEDEGMEYAYFGGSSEETSASEIIAQFCKRVYSATVITETDLILGFESYEFVTDSGVYGEDPFALSADGFAPAIDIDDFIGEKFSDDFYFRRKPDDITEVFAKVYESFGNIAGMKILPVLDFEGFKKEETAGIFEYLTEKGAAGWFLLYNDYFTGIPEEPETVPEEAPSQPSAPAVPAVPEVPYVPEEPSEPESSESSSSEESGQEGTEEKPGIKDLTPKESDE